MDETLRALDRARQHSQRWLTSLGDRPVPATADAHEIAEALGRLPDRPTDAAEVIDLMATACEPGLVAMPSGRFFGFVIGGTHPAALAADWLVSAWDQNAGLRGVTPAAAAVEDVAAGWLLDLLGLPLDSAVGFTSGATMSNFTCLAAARDQVLRDAGWDVTTHGLQGDAPHVRVLAGADRHDTIDLALRYLGLGLPETVAVDGQGRMLPEALAEALSAGPTGPTIVCLAAGNVHSGSFDPFEAAGPIAHDHGAWVHVDGAFGLWAAASRTHRGLMAGCDEADSWTTDAHKTLNVPYDCGLAIVRDQAALVAAMSSHGAYLIRSADPDPTDKVPELSRRARGFTVWATLRALGRDGVDALVARLCTHAQHIATEASRIPGVEVLNDVDFTQVCFALDSDELTRRAGELLLEDGTAWISGSHWRDRAVLRVSVSNWGTTTEDVDRTLDALRAAVKQAYAEAT